MNRLSLVALRRPTPLKMVGVISETEPFRFLAGSQKAGVERVKDRRSRLRRGLSLRRSVEAGQCQGEPEWRAATWALSTWIARQALVPVQRGNLAAEAEGQLRLLDKQRLLVPQPMSRRPAPATPRADWTAGAMF
jgi:hypothetical protein